MGARILSFVFLLAVVPSACSDSLADHSDVMLSKSSSALSMGVENYCWLEKYDAKQSVEERIKIPNGFERLKLQEGSFGEWLRYLPLKEGKPNVHLYNGQLKNTQDVHVAVIDIDAGLTDLQQCADAVMRMRGEYLFSKKQFEEIHFNFTSGDVASFKKWSEGYRPSIKGNKVNWNKTAAKDESHKSFRQFMDVVFTYAGTLSLSKELKHVEVKDMQVGDVFIFGGSPGHAVLVVDMAENKTTKEKLFIIQQSYMPAQEIHILKNYQDPNISPWYNTNLKEKLDTPEWTFTSTQLMRF